MSIDNVIPHVPIVNVANDISKALLDKDLLGYYNLNEQERQDAKVSTLINVGTLGLGSLIREGEAAVSTLKGVSEADELQSGFKSGLTMDLQLFAEKGIKSTRYLDELTPDELSKFTPEQLKKALPDGWTYSGSPDGRFVHIKDGNGNYRIRIDPPDKVTDYKHMHIVDGKGNAIDINGNIVPLNSPNAHIPR